MPKASTESNRNIIEEHGPPHITKEKKKVSFLIVSQSVNDLTGTDNKKSTPSVPNRTPSDNIKKMISAFERNAKQVRALFQFIKILLIAWLFLIGFYYF